MATGSPERETGAASADAPSPVLSLRGLRVDYEGRPALRDLDLDLAPGERLALVGPNGAGKSTLLRAIAGLLPPAAGLLRVHGHPAGQDRCVAYVPQRGAVDWSFPLKVRDVVMQGRLGLIGPLRRPRARDRQVVRDCLAQVRLEALADQRIDALSGGQQQRMFLARALAQEAELVLMDEPFAGLDARSREDVLTGLDRLRSDGVAVIVVTHDLALAAEAFDRVLLLCGRPVALGPASEVLTEAHLLEAYGGHVRALRTEEGRLLVGPGPAASEPGEPAARG